MKKIIITVLISISFLSCKKLGQCYECEFGVVNGYKPPNEKYCGPLPYNKKINGEDVPTWCR